MSHQIGWIDDEMVGVTWCGATRLTTALGVSIYDWVECPHCGKQLKLRQINEIVEQGSEPNG